MKTVALLIEYLGTHYAGWQRQTNALGIQQVIEDALTTICQETIVLFASGRTDAGVHARGQVAHFKTNSPIPSERFTDAINRLLPNDIVILDSCRVADDFHARFEAISKLYCYQIYPSSRPSAIYNPFVWWMPKKFDCKRLTLSLYTCLGKQDFAALSKGANEYESTVRVVESIQVQYDRDLLLVRIQGKGFLRHMVRIMVGTAMDIALGQAEMDMLRIIQSKDRTLAGRTAPAKGLFLEKVNYDLDLFG